MEYVKATGTNGLSYYSLVTSDYFIVLTQDDKGDWKGVVLGKVTYVTLTHSLLYRCVADINGITGWNHFTTD